MCKKCGCNSCETKSTALVLKESKFVHTPVSDGLKYHIDNKIPLNENIYRIGSKEYMKLYSEARALYSRGKLDVSEDDKYFLTETHIGNFGMFKGERVPLDIPILNEDTNTAGEPSDEELKREYDNILSREYELTRIYTDNRSEENWDNLVQIRSKNQSLEDKLAKKGLIDLPGFKATSKASSTVALSEELCAKGKAYRKRRMAAGEKSSAYLSGRAVKVCKGQMSGKKKKKANENTAPNHNGKAAPYGSGYKKLDLNKMSESLRDWFEKENWVRINTSGNISGDCGTMKKNKATTRCLPKKKAQSLTKAERKATVAKKVRGSKKGKQFVSVDEFINEAKKKKKTEKKDPPIGKPKRGGSKAYYVYVRDPKTKKVKKVSFGSGGLRAKIRNPKARKAFAARHNCKNKKDRTTAGYWSCNLPRYAPALGLGAKMNTFW
jgi:hypothetical protein|tara:strand:- start:409 stop:1719 length:1311 start_codon:yes stop_codon:yes gene_type:complete